MGSRGLVRGEGGAAELGGGLRGQVRDQPLALEQLVRLGEGQVLRRHDRVEQLVVLKTDAGYSQPLAEAIDRARLPQTVGTIAGENTILVICRSAADAAAFTGRLDELMKG